MKNVTRVLQPFQLQNVSHLQVPVLSERLSERENTIDSLLYVQRKTQREENLTGGDIAYTPSISAPSSSSGLPPSTFAAMLLTIVRIASEKKKQKIITAT